MLLLTSTSDLITVTTGSAGSIAVHSSWVDNAAGTITPGRTNTPLISTATTTTVTAAPAASTQRNVRKLNVNNVSGSVANAIVINHTDGTTVIALWDGTLAIGESVEMDETGTFNYYDATGALKISQTIPASAWASPGTIGSTTPNTGAFTTLSATGAFTASPANLSVTLSPTGTGTVTLNPATAGTINNVSVGATTRATGAFSLIGAGGASAASAYITVAAGTATVASATLTGGTVLTTAAAGAVENDSVNLYFTSNTGDGRGRVPVEQTFRLNANGTAFNTISNFFGTTSNVSLVSGGVYEIEIEVYFTKTTAEAVTWTFTNSAAPTGMNIHAEFSPLAGISNAGGAANLCADVQGSVSAAQTLVTGTLATGVTHYARFKIQLANATGTSLKIQAACTTASGITPLRGSRWRSMRLPTSTNIGTFAA